MKHKHQRRQRRPKEPRSGEQLKAWRQFDRMQRQDWALARPNSLMRALVPFARALIRIAETEKALIAAKRQYHRVRVADMKSVAYKRWRKALAKWRHQRRRIKVGKRALAAGTHVRPRF